MVNIYILHQLV